MMPALRDLYDTETEDISQLDLPEAVRTPGRTWTEIAFDGADHGNGMLSVSFSHPDVEVFSITEAHDRYPEKVDDVLFSGVDPDENRVVAAHARLVEDAVFVHVPEGAVVEEPIDIMTAARDGFYPHHVLVYVEDGAVATVVERNKGDGSTDSSFTELYVGRDATLHYTKINDLETDMGYAENAATVQENGQFNSLMLSVGSDLYRNRLTTELAGPRSSFQYNCGFLAADDQHMDITTHVVHAADSTRCDMDARGVAMDRSRTIYKGVQEVTENAEATESFQDETTIMIGDDCEADTTPQLQIDNNDVIATHAATTGHIDEEDLFYMKSRGLHETEAKREIITGMFDDLIEQGTDDGKNVMHRKIANTLGR